MHRHFLLESGLITQADLQQALGHREAHGGTLPQHLVGLGSIDEGSLARALSARHAVPMLAPRELEQIPPEIVAHLTAEIAVEHRAVPIRIEGDQLVVAMSDPGDEHAVEEVTFFASMYVQRAVVFESVLDWALGHYYGHGAATGQGSQAADDELDGLFAGKREPSQLILLDRPKRPDRDTDERPTVPLPSPLAALGDLPPAGEGAPTIRMPTVQSTVETPGLPVSLLEARRGGREVRKTEEMAGIPPGLLAEREESQVSGLVFAEPGEAAGDSEQAPEDVALMPTMALKRDDFERRPTDDFERRPTTVLPTVAASAETTPSLDEEPSASGDADAVSVGRAHFTARHGRVVRRKRRTTMSGIAPTSDTVESETVPSETVPSETVPSETVASETVASETGQPPAGAPKEASAQDSSATKSGRFPRRTRAEVPMVTDLKAALSSATEAIRSATSDEDVAQAVLDYLGLICERRALIRVVDGEEIHGWAAAGGSLATSSFRSLEHSIDRSSVFGAVVMSMIPYQGPLLYDRDERVFAAHIGKHPEQIILVPVVVDDEVTALIYGDGLTALHALPLVREMARELAATKAAKPQK